MMASIFRPNAKHRSLHFITAGPAFYNKAEISASSELVKITNSDVSDD